MVGTRDRGTTGTWGTAADTACTHRNNGPSGREQKVQSQQRLKLIEFEFDLLGVCTVYIVVK